MGLHPDVKTFLRSRFPSSVGDAIPREPCEVLVCDQMWILFRFSPDDESTGEDLVDFVWGPILKFFRGGRELLRLRLRRPRARPDRQGGGTQEKVRREDPRETVRRVFALLASVALARGVGRSRDESRVVRVRVDRPRLEGSRAVRREASQGSARVGR